MSVKNGALISTHSIARTPEEIGVEGAIPVNEPLKVYHIFLAVNSSALFTEEQFQIRKYVATVVARDLEEAFKLAQNDFNPEYASKKQRSCSVGDLIQDNEGFYMVCSSGFKLICLLETGHD
jgi:hypothetical protein